MFVGLTHTRYLLCKTAAYTIFFPISSFDYMDFYFFDYIFPNIVHVIINNVHSVEKGQTNARSHGATHGVLTLLNYVYEGFKMIKLLNCEMFCVKKK